jgi:hypothetical protein
MVKFTFYFIETTHERLHVDKVLYNIMNVPTSFIPTIIFFDGAFECGGGSKF